MAEGDEPSLRGMHHRQRKREVDCAVKLAEMLDKATIGNKSDVGASSADGAGVATAASFAAESAAVANELARTFFGELLCHTIGGVYVSKSEQARGGSCCCASHTRSAAEPVIP